MAEAFCTSFARTGGGRQKDYGRTHVTTIDLLITTFSTPNSIVAECFERVGVAAERLTELAVAVEQESSLS